MARFRQLCAAFALTVILAASVFAGDTPYPGESLPSGVPVAGDTPYPGESTSGALEEIALALAGSVLSLL